MKTYDDLHVVFESLKIAGIMSIEGDICCRTCLHSAGDMICHETEAIGFAGYHIQDVTHCHESNILSIRYHAHEDDDGAATIGRMVADMLDVHGFDVVWDGDPDKVIEVHNVDLTAFPIDDLDEVTELFRGDGKVDPPLRLVQ